MFQERYLFLHRMHVNHRLALLPGIGNHIACAAQRDSRQAVPDGDQQVARVDQPVSQRHVGRV